MVVMPLLLYAALLLPARSSAAPGPSVTPVKLKK